MRLCCSAVECARCCSLSCRPYGSCNFKTITLEILQEIVLSSRGAGGGVGQAAVQGFSINLGVSCTAITAAAV